VVVLVLEIRQTAVEAVEVVPVVLELVLRFR
jgi:hypothetical protein